MKNKKYMALMLLLALLLSACGKPEGKEPSSSRSTVPMSDGSVSGTDGGGTAVSSGVSGTPGENSAVSSGVSETPGMESSAEPALRILTYRDWTLADICPSGEGWLLAAEGRAEEYRRYAEWILPLDVDLTAGELEDRNYGDVEALLEADGSLWTAGRGEDSYPWVYRDGEPLFSSRRWPDVAWCQLAWEDGILYTVLNRELWINENQVELPQNGGDAQYEVLCVVREGGRMYALLSLWNGGQWLCPIDGTTGRINIPDTEFPIKAEHACWNENGTWLLSGSTLFRLEDGACTALGDLNYLGIETTYLRRLRVCSDGSFLALSAESLIRFSPVTEDAARTLILGAYRPAADYEAAVAAFNRAGTGWHVVVKEFDNQEGMQALNLSLLGGELDLICTQDEVLLRNYAAKGLLAPIDPAVTDRVLPNVADLCTLDGECCYLPRKVGLEASRIPTKYVDDPAALTTLSALTDLIERTCPETFLCYDRDLVFSNLTTYCADNWIDWETRTARFTDASFAELLEFSACFASTQEEAAANSSGSYNAGRRWLHLMDQFSADQYNWWKDDDPEKNEPGWTFFRFPLEPGRGLALKAQGFFAPVRGEKAEGAQAFLDFLFSEDQWYDEPRTASELHPQWYPAQTALCRKLLDKKLEADGNREEDRQTLADWLTMFEQADHFGSITTTEIDIILREEAEPFFQGDITAEEAARRIQNRVEIYLAERG